MKNPKVIVLILSYNGKHLLDEAISSYLINDYLNFEVVVIDNGSTDGTKDYILVKYPQVKVLRTDVNLKYSGGFNFGLNYAFNIEKADYVLISNNDIKADKKVISELVKVALLDEKNGFVTGKVYFYDEPNKLQTVGKKYDPIRWNGGHIGNGEIDVGQYDEIAERYFSDDIFMLVSRKLYETVGGYDTEFAFQSEEYDWQARAKKYGFKIMYTPYAKIWHKESATIGKASAFKLYYDARNPMIVIMKHKDADFFRKFFYNHFYNSILSVVVQLKKGRINTSISILRGLLSGLFFGFKNNLLTIKHFIGKI